MFRGPMRKKRSQNSLHENDTTNKQPKRTRVIRDKNTLSQDGVTVMAPDITPTFPADIWRVIISYLPRSIAFPAIQYVFPQEDYDSTSCTSIAAYDALPLLQWAHLHGWEWSVNTCASAAANGRLENVKWLHEARCPWDALTCAAAAFNGDLPMLKWLRLHKCPWDEDTCATAACNGHVHVLEWAIRNGCRCNVTASSYITLDGKLSVTGITLTMSRIVAPDIDTIASSHEHMKIRRAIGNCSSSLDLTRFAAESGDIEFLQHIYDWYCHEETLPCISPKDDVKRLHSSEPTCVCETTFTLAALAGHLDALKFLREHGCPWGENAWEAAAISGHLGTLEWLYAQGCPWNQNACTAAATNGHLDVLQWLRARDCPWDVTTCVTAAAYGHPRVLAWAYEHGCPLDRARCLAEVNNGYILLMLGHDTKDQQYLDGELKPNAHTVDWMNRVVRGRICHSGWIYMPLTAHLAKRDRVKRDILEKFIGLGEEEGWFSLEYAESQGVSLYEPDEEPDEIMGRGFRSAQKDFLQVIAWLRDPACSSQKLSV